MKDLHRILRIAIYNKKHQLKQTNYSSLLTIKKLTHYANKKSTEIP